MTVYSYCIAWAYDRDRYMNHVNNFGGADNAAKKGEQACTFQKV